MASSTQIQTWIDEVESQRQKVALGQAYVDIWRDGRRIRLNIPDLDALNRLLAQYRSELTAAQIAEGVTPTGKRRAIGLAWNN